MIVVRPGELEDLVRLERKVPSTTFGSAGADEWELVEEIWVGIQDKLPSRGEQIEGGFTTSTRPARVRMYWRDDIDPIAGVASSILATPTIELTLSGHFHPFGENAG